MHRHGRELVGAERAQRLGVNPAVRLEQFEHRPGQVVSARKLSDKFTDGSLAETMQPANEPFRMDASLTVSMRKNIATEPMDDYYFLCIVQGYEGAAEQCMDTAVVAGIHCADDEIGTFAQIVDR